MKFIQSDGKKIDYPLGAMVAVLKFLDDLPDGVLVSSNDIKDHIGKWTRILTHPNEYELADKYCVSTGLYQKRVWGNKTTIRAMNDQFRKQTAGISGLIERSDKDKPKARKENRQRKNISVGGLPRTVR